MVSKEKSGPIPVLPDHRLLQRYKDTKGLHFSSAFISTSPPVLLLRWVQRKNKDQLENSLVSPLSSPSGPTQGNWWLSICVPRGLAF